MAKIPERYEGVTFEGLKPERKAALEKWIEQYKSPEGKESLMIFGKPGTGKTHALYALLEKRPNLRHRFFNAPELIEQIKASFHDNYARDPVDEIKAFEGYLFIDDLACERLATGFEQDKFYLIINDRYLKKQPVLITTNFSLEEIGERLGERIASRLAEMCFIINFTGPDQRFNK